MHLHNLQTDITTYPLIHKAIILVLVPKFWKLITDLIIIVIYYYYWHKSTKVYDKARTMYEPLASTFENDEHRQNCNKYEINPIW